MVRAQIGEITPNLAARLLGVKRRTIWRWCRERRLSVRVDATGHYFLNRVEIESIVADTAAWRDRWRAVDKQLT